MNIFINSKLHNIPDSVNTVEELLAYLRIPEEGTGVGINNKIIPARDRAKTPIKDEDRITVISAAYGG